MKYQLANDKMQITVDEHGAELRSLLGASGREYLWQADPKYWGRTSPVLFPFVGMPKDKEFSYQGKTYPMGQHGFARDRDFRLLKQEGTALEFMLESDEDSLKVYPFKFRLRIRYELEGSSVRVIWRVQNTGDELMHFSIGAHPAFYCPLEEGESTCRLGFDHAGPLDYQQITGEGLCLPETKQLTLNDRKWAFEKSAFDDGVYIFTDYQLHQVSMLDKNNRPYLTVDFHAPLVGIWSPEKKNAPFICIEPWYGRCDPADEKPTLENRPYGNQLPGGAEFRAEYTISIHEQ